MKKITAFLAALLSLIVQLPLKAQQKTVNDQSLLWRISGKGLARPSFLFGTIHLICPGDYLWTKKMKESLDNSDKVCFEMDLDDQSVMMEVAVGLMDQSGKKLKDYFTAEQYQVLERYFKNNLDMDLALLQQLKPVALQTMLSMHNAGCENPISYEDSIMKTAIKKHKEIIGLEEPKEQIAVLESTPVDTVIAQLMNEAENKSNDKSEYEQMVAAYKRQDLPQLYQLILSAKDEGTDMNIFLDERNKKWIMRMPPKMQHSSVFFAVGAGHLWGPNGVISLLRKAGYTVEPVK